MKIEEKYYPFIVVLTCLLLFFPHLDILYANIMEARNFNTAREMLHFDNWIFTTMNGEARYEKPPLPTWLSAFSGAIFGVNKLWALRLPSAIVTTLLVYFSYLFSIKRLQLPAKQALYGALLVATSFYVIFAGRNGTWDIFAHAFMLLGIYFLFQFFSTDIKKYTSAILAGLFIGLSFMSKGPVSHFALLLPFLISYLFIFRIRSSSGRAFPFMILIIIALALSSWWALALYFGDTDTAASIANKEATAWANHNTRPFYYYWSFFTQSGIWTIPAFIGLLYPYLKTRVLNLKAYQFTLLWTLSAVVLLSIIPEKKSRYLLPVLIPLALNTSFYIDYLVRKFSELKDKREVLPVYFNFSIIALAAALACPFLIYLFVDDFTGILWVYYSLFQVGCLFVAIFIIKNLKRKNIENAFYTVIFFTCLIITCGFPFIKVTYTNTNYKELAPKIVELERLNKPVFLYENSSPELIWDLGKRLPVLMSREGINYPKETSFYVIVEREQEELAKEKMVGYDFILQDCYDGNITSKKDRNYKIRRVGCLYLVNATD